MHLQMHSQCICKNIQYTRAGVYTFYGCLLFLYAGWPLEIDIKDKVHLHIDFQSMTISAILKHSFDESS